MKKIAVTIGDPGGIGPEVAIKAISSDAVRKVCHPILIGDSVVVEQALRLLNLPGKMRVIQSSDAAPIDGTIDLVDCAEIKGGFDPGRPAAKGGKACFAYIRKAVEFCMEKKVDAMATAPISKEALKMAGLKWPGHTEMIAELTAAKEYAMMLAGRNLRVILVTIHVPIRKVPDLITRDRVLKTIRLAKKAADMLGIAAPKIAVSGLNPHAGEAGMFGDEETMEIAPAVRDAVKEGIPAFGPYPPDTIFHSAYQGKFDIVVCMYHDQGLIPLKMMAFDVGVNVTVGLPIVRTSPDHGTAYDIAWKGNADPSSMIEAIRLASKLRP